MDHKRRSKQTSLASKTSLSAFQCCVFTQCRAMLVYLSCFIRKGLGILCACACCLKKAMEVQGLVANDDDAEAKHGL